jgi:fatty-acyl-CoA synthase
MTADGWFDTGDVAMIDADGYLQITDRAKDVIKTGGEWVSSIDIENAAMLHPAVANAAVIGVQHPKWQERPLLIIVPREGQTANADDIRDFIKGKLDKIAWPDAVEFVKELPLGATGKVLKTELRKKFKDYKLPA